MVWIAGFVVIAAAVVAGLWAYDRFIDPQEPIELQALEVVRFPQVRGSSLSGQSFTLPHDIEGDYALLMIAFQQVQQFDINTWLPIARDLSRQYTSLAYYELPTIDRLNPAARFFIDGGMRAGIPDPVARATTVTLYLDKPSFRQALEIPDEELIVVMLINREGEVLWRTSGPASPEAIEALQQAAKASLE